MKSEKSVISTVSLIVGLVLISASALLLLFTNLQKQNAATEAEKTVAELRVIMPAVHDEVPDGRANTEMPVMELNDENYCGIIELPVYGTELPIAAYWSRSSVYKHPNRYTGSIYDGTLIIGGSDNESQLDFIQTVTNGDTVYFTDMTGARYTCNVEKIERTDDVSAERLMSDSYGLTLFAKSTYSLDYIIVHCSF